jgi:ketosteroid isomerase-like protein
VSDVEDFLTEVLPRHHEAGERMHNGDAGLWLQMWSNQDPATVFGALGVAPIGAEQVAQNFREVARRFSDGRDFRFEVIAAGVSGDLAYTVGYESSTVLLDGGPLGPSRIRVTHVYRREGGEWKMVHRHGSRAPTPGE